MLVEVCFFLSWIVDIFSQPGLRIFLEFWWGKHGFLVCVRIFGFGSKLCSTMFIVYRGFWVVLESERDVQTTGSICNGPLLQWSSCFQADVFIAREVVVSAPTSEMVQAGTEAPYCVRLLCVLWILGIQLSRSTSESRMWKESALNSRYVYYYFKAFIFLSS